MHNTESDLENEIHNTLWDFEIRKKGHLDSGIPPYLVIVNIIKNRTCRIVDFSVSVDHREKLTEGEKRYKYHDIAKELKSYGT